jgi:hypothetical protein
VVLLQPASTWLGLEALVEDRRLIIGGAALIELSVPALLLARVTRNFGIATASMFHVALASSPSLLVMDFTAFILALLLLFGPADFGDRLRREGSEFHRRWPKVRSFRPVAHPTKWVFAGVFFIVLILKSQGLGEPGFQAFSWLVLLLFGWVSAVAGLWILGSYRSSPRPAPRHWRVMPSIAFHKIMVALLVVNVMSPYIGLKTTSSFTMFSNLGTEGGATNHMFIPRLSLFGYQDDVIQPIQSSNPVLTQHISNGEWLTYHEFRRILQADPHASVTFSRAGVEYRLDTANEVSDLIRLPWLESKLLHFRSIPADGRPQCRA